MKKSLEDVAESLDGDAPVPFPAAVVDYDPLDEPVTLRELTDVVAKVSSQYDGRNYGSAIVRLLREELKSLAQHRRELTSGTDTSTRPRRAG